jgi:hypothetical protein
MRWPPLWVIAHGCDTKQGGSPSGLPWNRRIRRAPVDTAPLTIPATRSTMRNAGGSMCRCARGETEARVSYGRPWPAGGQGG